MINRQCFQIIGFSGQYRFLFYGNKGQILLKSIEFPSLEVCSEAIIRCKECGVHEDNYTRLINNSKEYYFILRDAEGNELAYGKNSRTQAERNASLADCIKYIKKGIVIG